jgi:hypothetical protein
MVAQNQKSEASKMPKSPVKDDRFDRRLENDPHFHRHIEEARASLRAGRGVKLEDLESE